MMGVWQREEIRLEEVRDSASAGYELLCDKIQELIEDVSVLRHEAEVDERWDRMTRELDGHIMKLGQMAGSSGE